MTSMRHIHRWEDRHVTPQKHSYKKRADVGARQARRSFVFWREGGEGRRKAQLREIVCFSPAVEGWCTKWEDEVASAWERAREREGDVRLTASRPLQLEARRPSRLP